MAEISAISRNLLIIREIEIFSEYANRILTSDKYSFKIDA